MATFLLVPGAFNGKWCWERLVPLLEERGHRVVAPDLPGTGDDRTPLDEVNLESWGRFVADLAARQPEPPILVGHSRGGLVISQAAHEAPAVLAGLVYVSAMLTPDGMGLPDLFETLGGWPGTAITEHRTPDGLAAMIDTAALREITFNRTEPWWVDRALASLTPEPVSVMYAAPAFGPAAAALPRAFVESSDNRVMPLAFQRKMQSLLPCDPVITLDTDHSPFYSAPEQLADALDVIALRFAA